MEEKLKELFQTRRIQDQVITFRTEGLPIYGKYLKKEGSILLKNVIDAEVVSDVKITSKPKLIEINVDEYKTELGTSINELHKNIDNLATCLEYCRK